MTFIAEGGGRTVTNCGVYERRKVYEIKTVATLDEVASVYGTGEVEKTGNLVTQEIVYHVIADSDDMAIAFYKRRWGGEFQRHMLVSVKVLFCIDGEIGCENN